jgi:peptide methionine sulfoxide reductase msrA/msrB
MGIIKKEAIFWLWCFWGVQSYFDKIEWILETEVGYAWWFDEDANYENIWDHTEVIKIIYDEEQISYDDLIKFFIEKRDPTLPSYKRQYDSLILFSNKDEEIIATNLLAIEDKKHDRPINVRVEKFNWIYYKAEEYHQKYNEKATWKIICF